MSGFGNRRILGMQDLVTKSVTLAHLPIPIKPANKPTHRLFYFLNHQLVFCFVSKLNHSLLLLSHQPRSAFRPSLSPTNQPFLVHCKITSTPTNYLLSGYRRLTYPLALTSGLSCDSLALLTLFTALTFI